MCEQHDVSMQVTSYKSYGHCGEAGAGEADLTPRLLETIELIFNCNIEINVKDNKIVGWTIAHDK